MTTTQYDAEAAEFVEWLMTATERSQYRVESVETRLAYQAQMRRIMDLLARSERIHHRELPDIFLTSYERYSDAVPRERSRWSGTVARAFYVRRSKARRNHVAYDGAPVVGPLSGYDLYLINEHMCTPGICTCELE